MVESCLLWKCHTRLVLLAIDTFKATSGVCNPQLKQSKIHITETLAVWENVMLQEVESNQEGGGWTHLVLMLGWKAVLKRVVHDTDRQGQN